MERKATAFVEQFSATLFAQWAQQTQRRELFWLNASFLHNVLEEGIAKLPKVPVKAYLTRELATFVELLRVQLQLKHSEFQAQQPTETQGDALPLLLSEEDVERALATATSEETAVKLQSVLALDDVAASRLDAASKDNKATTEQLVAVVEQCAAQLSVVAARQYEQRSVNARKTALYMELLTRCVETVASKWCEQLRGKWVADASASACVEREKLSVLLQSLVVADLATHAQGSTAKPWTSFFCVEESALVRSLDAFKARAGVYGALLALVVSFPVVFEDDSDSDDANSSGDSSSDSEDEDEDGDSPKSRRKAAKLKRALKKKDRLDAEALAKQVARQVVLAAKSSPETSSDWYQAVLAAFHRFAKPSAFVTEEDDEEEDALSKHQQRALQDALAELYGRAFTATATAQWQHKAPLALLETLLCLRHASEFMRVDRKQTVAAIASATAQLTGVALPSAFWRWMTHVKKVFGGEHVVVQTTMKKLTKHKAEKKMANVLLHDSLLSLSELRVLVEQFAVFLDAEKERAHFVVARGPSAAVNGEPQDIDGTEATTDDALFFTDNAGGKSKKREAKTTAEHEARKRTRTTADAL